MPSNEFEVCLGGREAPFRVRDRELSSSVRVFGADELIGAFLRPRRKAAACPACGWTLAAVETSRGVGCPLCYEVFADQIRTFVRP